MAIGQTQLIITKVYKVHFAHTTFSNCKEIIWVPCIGAFFQTNSFLPIPFPHMQVATQRLEVNFYQKQLARSWRWWSLLPWPPTNTAISISWNILLQLLWINIIYKSLLTISKCSNRKEEWVFKTIHAKVWSYLVHCWKRSF